MLIFYHLNCWTIAFIFFILRKIMPNIYVYFANINSFIYFFNCKLANLFFSIFGRLEIYYIIIVFLV